MCKQIKTKYPCGHSTCTIKYCAKNPSSSRILCTRPTSSSSGFSTSSWRSSFFGIPARPVSPPHETSREHQNSTLICCDCERQFLRSHLMALRKEVDGLGSRRNIKDDVTVLRREGITGTPPYVERGSVLTRRGIEEGVRPCFQSYSTISGLQLRQERWGMLWDSGSKFGQEDRFREQELSLGKEKTLVLSE